MDCVSPILDVASRLWDCTSNRASYICELPENLNSLRNALQQLNNVCADVKERVDHEEKLHKKRTHAVDGWIKSVEAMENEVNALLSEGDEEIQNKCLGTCCPKNCRASYGVGKMMRAKIEDVASKTTEGLNFSVVAEPLPSPAVIERPSDEMVGVDAFFNHVFMQLQDEKVTKLGLYGIGGVGKTTLLNRINNEFLKTRVELDVVIWVTVSRPTNVEKIQRDVFDRLGILETKWDGRSEDRRKEEIFSVLKCKKFVLLLDDVWEPVDLLAMGIPPLHDGSGSKVVLTTRFSSVCRDMGAKGIEVKSLAWKDAFALFQKYVGEETINSHPQIRQLAEMAAKECDGLPLALVVIGRAMAAAKTPEEWEKKIQLLKKYPEKFPGMEKHLFTRLAFSYDSLLDETTKICFLYCSLFPEDYEIRCDELIQLWIGEGFLDEYNNIKEARNGGEEIIASLSHACLLEKGTDSHPLFYFYHEACVKMHDVIRDMALWLACHDDGNKKQKKFVVANERELVTTNEIAKWKEAQRISLFETSFEEHLESPSFPNLQTLILCNERAITLPIGFFNYMSNIRVLNLAHLGILYLPVEIGKLYSLRYLNLTATDVTRIPKELGKLEGLRCLILDQMSELEDFPSGIISGLSSLQLFSFQTHSAIQRKWMLEELEGLKCMEEVSITLHDVLPMQTLMNSHKLSVCLKALTFSLVDCIDMHIIQLSSRYLERLTIEMCSGLEDVVVNMKREGAYAPSNSPSHQYSSQLSHLIIDRCPNLKKLTCLVYAPNLKFLMIRLCGSLEEVMQVEEECGNSSEIKCERNDDVFLRLSYLILICLGNLRSICRRGGLLFPSLEVMEVRGCPRLRKLPFHSDITRRSHVHLQEINGSQEWWDQLEWEDPSIQHHLTPYFHPIRTSMFG